MSSENFQKLANTKFDIKAAKLALLERVDAQLTFPYGGGLFKATPLLLAEVMAYGTRTKAVILDEYNNPIEVTIASFKDDVIQARQYALNSYQIDYEGLKKVRKGDKL